MAAELAWRERSVDHVTKISYNPENSDYSPSRPRELALGGTVLQRVDEFLLIYMFESANILSQSMWWSNR